jgi:hypothetical protein
MDMKKLQAATISLLLVMLVACGEGRVEGTYVNVANRSEFIELKPGGEFHLKAGELELNGRFLIKGKEIILDPGKGIVARGTLEKGLIVDRDGTRWQKQ